MLSYTLSIIFYFFFFFSNRISLLRTGCPGTLCVKQAGLQLTEIHHALPAECCYLSYVPPHKTKLSFIFDYYVINYCHVPPQQTKISIMFYHYVANYLLDSEDQLCTQKLTVDSHYQENNVLSWREICWKIMIIVRVSAPPGPHSHYVPKNSHRGLHQL